MSTTKFMWTAFKTPDLRPFVFFGSSSGDDCRGINPQRPSEIIAHHHNMEHRYEVVGTDIIDAYRADYARYEELG